MEKKSPWDKKSLSVWLACFIDAEGNISVHKRNSRHSAEVKMRVRVSNTCPYVIDFAHKNFGGNKRKPRDKGIKSARSYGLSWTGNKAKNILRRIYPFLIIKKEHAKLAIRFPMSIRGKHCSKQQKEERRNLAKQLYKLNKKGPERIWICGKQ